MSEQSMSCGPLDPELPGGSESETPATPADRFDLLVAGFFDGILNDAEDREFAALLDSDPAKARRFLELSRLDRAIAGLCSTHRVNDEAFEEAVRKSLSLDGEHETNRFAQEVVQLVRANPKRPRRSVRNPAANTTFGIGVAAACAAVAILIFLIATHSSTPVAENRAGRAEPVPVAPSVEPRTSHGDNAAPPGNANTKKNSKVIPPPAPKEVVDTTQLRQPDEVENVPEPVNPESRVAESAPDAATTHSDVPSLGSITRIQRAAAIVQRMQESGAEANARVNDRCAEGDLLRVVPTLGNNTSPCGVEVTLKDGSRLWLSGGTSLRFHEDNGAAASTLENGEVSARVTPQVAGHPFRIRTRLGPAVEVIGTVFELSADAVKKRVSLRVDEGKVLFTNQGVERKVSAGESSDAEDGRAPSSPYAFRPRPAMLAGVVTEKAGGKPLAGAVVSVIPVARRKTELKGEVKWPTVKTDAQGRFKFDALREGNIFVAVESESNGMLGHWGVARARLASGEETDVNISVDKAMLVIGKLLEDTHSVSAKDFRVRFIGDNSDGQAVNPTLNLMFAEGEFASVAIQGAGRYIPLVEKPGSIVKIRSPKTVGLVPDRINQVPLDVQIAASATLKGRILEANGNPLIDDATIDGNDPRQAHTNLTLTLPNGWLQSVCAEADGSYSFSTNLDSGNYELKVQRFGYAPFSKRLTLTAGQSIDLDVSLEAGHR
jgi:ferric-dicitrate binding protein FerR (iron transport regulator)